MVKYKFAVMILYFDCEQFILRTIENCAPFVEKIYVMYSELPFSNYNPEATNKFRNTSDKEVLKKSKYYNKIELIEGNWVTEDGTRNECLYKAKKDGFDFLILQDADEFYLPEDYKKNIEGMILNPQHSCYQVPWILFWKNTNYVLQYRKHGNKRNVTITTCPVYAVNLKKDVYFVDVRWLSDMIKPYLLDGLCYHLSWVLSDEDVYRKISTWAHSHEVEIDKWFRWKWLAWEPETKFLEVRNYIGVKKAILYKSPLPAELKDFPVPEQKLIKISLIEKFFRWLNDIKYFIILFAKWPYYLIRYRKNIL